MDGVPYFFNSKTNCLSWEKPDVLLTEAERAQGLQQWVWVRDGDAGWVPVRVVECGGGCDLQESMKGNKVTGCREDGHSVSGVASEGEVHWASLRELPDDVVLLEDTNEPSILYTVE